MLSSALVTSLVFFAIYHTHYLANSVYNQFNRTCWAGVICNLP